MCGFRTPAWWRRSSAIRMRWLSGTLRTHSHARVRVRRGILRRPRKAPGRGPVPKDSYHLFGWEDVHQIEGRGGAVVLRTENRSDLWFSPGSPGPALSSGLKKPIPIPSEGTAHSGGPLKRIVLRITALKEGLLRTPRKVGDEMESDHLGDGPLRL